MHASLSYQIFLLCNQVFQCNAMKSDRTRNLQWLDNKPKLKTPSLPCNRYASPPLNGPTEITQKEKKTMCASILKGNGHKSKEFMMTGFSSDDQKQFFLPSTPVVEVIETVPSVCVFVCDQSQG